MDCLVLTELLCTDISNMPIVNGQLGFHAGQFNVDDCGHSRYHMLVIPVITAVWVVLLTSNAYRPSPASRKRVGLRGCSTDL